MKIPDYGDYCAVRNRDWQNPMPEPLISKQQFQEIARQRVPFIGQLGVVVDRLARSKGLGRGSTYEARDMVRPLPIKRRSGGVAAGDDG